MVRAKKETRIASCIQRLFPLATALAGFALVSCSVALDGSSELSKQAVIDSVNIALSERDCNKAIGIVEPVYNSPNVDNRIRLVRAAAYACAANLNFFELIAKLQANTAKLPSNQVWNVFTEAFPSDPTDPYDRVIEGAEGATDALLASLRPNSVLLSNYLFNLASPNPSSGQYTDRTDDSNVFLTFVSMATIGGYHSRFGNPNPVTFNKRNILPWNTATALDMDTDGCGYASSLVNFADALGGIQKATTGSLATTLESMRSIFQGLIYGACDVGCHAGAVGIEVDGVTPVAGWVPSECTVAGGSCAGCPPTLRNRTSCLKRNSDINSCAAAGIVNFMNKHSLGWAGPP